MKTSDPKDEVELSGMFQPSVPFRASLILGLCLALLLAVGSNRAQESQPSEYQLKAAFLFNFAKFVEWPSESFAGPKSPIVIGILGKTPPGKTLFSDLEGTVRDKTINDRPLTIMEVNSPAEATNCHVLFIVGKSDKKRLREIFDGLKVIGILTVGDEIEQFTETGGMINFVKENNRIRFQINNENAKHAGLKISSKLLEYAVRPKR